MFLKKIEIQGFKSFADKVVINFENDVTGVVGPNGCGKSNIADAIRWVLGEQSVKSLRGSTMTDVIFAGSADRKMVNMAEVTLVFDNTQRFLNSDADEIEVTRRIYRNGQDAEYCINRARVRHKDVLDLIMDSGIGKDSLSMISQGNISSFADAKPSDRRAIFEEAAGVSKYKKRKFESLSKLERTKDNLERTQDIVNELERQVHPLRRQAKKAELYRQKKQRLEEIEIAVLVDDIRSLNEQIEEAKKELFNLESQITMFETSIQVHETQSADEKKIAADLEHQINQLQGDLLKTIHEIQILETRKIELDEKRKYAIQVGNREQKAKELQSLMSEAKFEYEDRQNRCTALQAEIDLLSQQLTNCAMESAEATQKQEESAAKVRRLQNRHDYLQNILKEPFNSQAGVRSIMDNKNSLKGVMGVVGQVLKPHDTYEVAISTALGGAMYNIVTEDEVSARHAIGFLKRNQSGRATFLPCNILQAHSVARDHQVICENTQGYLGVASTFVDYEECYQPIVQSLLNNVILVDNLENGNNLAALLRHSYKFVTLEGDVIHRGGSMSGGKTKNSTSIVTAEKELKEISQRLDSETAASLLATQAVQTCAKKRSQIEHDLMEKRISLASLEPVVDAKRARYEKLKNDLEQLGLHDADNEATFADEVIVRLNEAYSTRDNLNSSIKMKRQQKGEMGAQAERKEQQIRQVRKDLSLVQAKEREIQIDKTRMETRLENSLNRLASEYQLTYEFAQSKVNEGQFEISKEEVQSLRQEIENLGNVNMNAPEEYEEVNTRYEFMKKQMEDLSEACDKILKAIDEMDSVMTVQFKEMFDKINKELNETFCALFGGGKARLILEDPHDLLNTGIDIDVQPPGKSVQNIRLFSGGEKSLIAICVLFSILKVRPVPLCIFDEAEAALDQGNVERFARYLSNFAHMTQFIVITHRPGTMEQCDVLYGVTMQKRGVSQMLKVELKDAVEMADPQTEAQA